MLCFFVPDIAIAKVLFEVVMLIVDFMNENDNYIWRYNVWSIDNFQ